MGEEPKTRDDLTKTSFGGATILGKGDDGHAGSPPPPKRTGFLGKLFAMLFGPRNRA